MYYHPPQPKKKRFARFHIILILLALVVITFLLPKNKTNDDNKTTKVENQLGNPTSEAISEKNSNTSELLPTVAPKKVVTKSPVTKPSVKTELAKLVGAPDPVEEPTLNFEQTLTIQKGDTLSALFKRAELPQSDMHVLLKQIKHKKYLTFLNVGKKVTFTKEKDGQLNTILYHLSPQKKLIVSKAADMQFESQIKRIKPGHKIHTLSATIHDSLYSTGIKQQIPHKLLTQLTKIFARKINFSRDIRDDDHFTLIYETNEFDEQPSMINKILAASFTNKKSTHIALQYNKFDKSLNYFTPEGRSLRLSFDRYPVEHSHISSQFNPHRMHPILHKARPHKGVDLAARHGMPIKAVADGRVAFIGRGSGYGNMVKIKHSEKYETLYAHMSRFRPGISQGSYVKRGQVIGYVGQTGLATAPHCHYEFHVNGRSVNPLTVKLPSAESIKRKNMPKFKQQTQKLLEQLVELEAKKKQA